MSGEDERPIRPAGQTLLRAFNGQNVATAGRSYTYEYGNRGEEEDNDDLEMSRQVLS